jgi:hypothetical protein
LGLREALLGLIAKTPEGRQVLTDSDVFVSGHGTPEEGDWSRSEDGLVRVLEVNTKAEQIGHVLADCGPMHIQPTSNLGLKAVPKNVSLLRQDMGHHPPPDSTLSTASSVVTPTTASPTTTGVIIDRLAPRFVDHIYQNSLKGSTDRAGLVMI